MDNFRTNTIIFNFSNNRDVHFRVIIQLRKTWISDYGNYPAKGYLIAENKAQTVRRKKKCLNHPVIFEVCGFVGSDINASGNIKLLCYS